MALEIVVRPVVFPDIRPAPARTLPPLDDPEKGICEIKGTSSFVVQFSTSSSWSVTYAKAKETERRIDEARIYQKEDDGSINKQNFVDIDVANRIKFKIAGMPVAPALGGEKPGSEFKEIFADRIEVRHYAPVKEQDNVEVKKKNKIKKEEAQKE